MKENTVNCQRLMRKYFTIITISLKLDIKQNTLSGIHAIFFIDDSLSLPFSLIQSSFLSHK
jgi:hypothetical protein